MGTLLLAALVLGAGATLVALARRRGGGRIERLPLAGAVFFGTWLAVGVGLLSHMQRLQPRFLEAVTPAIAAVAGVGLARLVSHAETGRRRDAVALLGGVAVCAVGAVLVGHPPAWAAVLALGALAGCAMVAAASAWPRRTAALAVLGLVAVLAVPGAAAASVARHHRSDAGLPLRTDPARLAALSRFLIAHQGSARYEVASPTVIRAAPLIIRDARPVLMLTSLYDEPLLGPAGLQHLVATGQVRYALLGRTSYTRRGCPAVVRWAHTHARDVSAAAGQPGGTVYRLRATGGA